MSEPSLAEVIVDDDAHVGLFPVGSGYEPEPEPEPPTLPFPTTWDG